MLLHHPRINAELRATSPGAVEDAKINPPVKEHHGEDALDTGAFRVGNFQLDYDATNARSACNGRRILAEEG
ncbi:MAG: hypothetical protein R3C68_13675 [Myxococcota bacterium]